ncbi:hypothetical protein [Halobacterium yunchengense]|uniref:hypothetical protein n=1 Tax=Halobacterium yunchengense TaxID=3108497 RepID=UPI00300AC7EA
MGSRSDRGADWLGDRHRLRFAVTAAVPALAYAAARVWLSDAAAHSALALGAVFGFVFALVTALGRRALAD